MKMNKVIVQFLRNGKTGLEDGEAITFTSKVGATGETGEGAYELAVAAGYKGTKETFVSALSEIGAIEELLSQI